MYLNHINYNKIKQPKITLSFWDWKDNPCFSECVIKKLIQIKKKKDSFSDKKKSFLQRQLKFRYLYYLKNKQETYETSDKTK